MTTRITVEAHCPADTEVRCGITSVPITDQLMEVVTLQSGEKHEMYVHGSRIAVVMERKKQPPVSNSEPAK